MQLSVVCYSEHAAEPLQIHIRGADLMARGKTQSSCLLQCDQGLFACNLQQGGLGWFRLAIDEIHDFALMLAHNRRVRRDCEIANR